MHSQTLHFQTAALTWKLQYTSASKTEKALLNYLVRLHWSHCNLCSQKCLQKKMLSFQLWRTELTTYIKPNPKQLRFGGFYLIREHLNMQTTLFIWSVPQGRTLAESMYCCSTTKALYKRLSGACTMWISPWRNVKIFRHSYLPLWKRIVIINTELLHSCDVP